VQKSLATFFKPTPSAATLATPAQSKASVVVSVDSSGVDPEPSGVDEDTSAGKLAGAATMAPSAAIAGAPDPTASILCAKCLRPMREKGGPVLLPSQRTGLGSTGELPQLKRLRGYKRTAEVQGVPFLLSERQASAIMRQNCIACGAQPSMRGHGLTRLRIWPEGTTCPARGGYMGPFHEENVAAACAMCNMMKGYCTLTGFVERVRHIATNHTPGEDFGSYPHRFKDNISKRTRSCYITNSTTHTKTHAISNDDFKHIVSQPCYYCRKEPRKPKTLGPDDRGHFNGLDRLDSTNRVYTTQTVVACCGDCNIMKYRWPLEGFLDHCRAVARFNVGRQLPDEAAEGQCGDAGAEDEDEQENADCAAILIEDAEADEEDAAEAEDATDDGAGKGGNTTTGSDVAELAPEQQ